MEKQQASPEMKVFFEKLLELKADAEKLSGEDWDEYHGPVWKMVYERLDAIIKEKK